MTQEVPKKSNLYVLRPRKLSLSERLDDFLEQHSLVASDSDPTRPVQSLPNAVRCANCGLVEYARRGSCRCGHYLSGQLQDEFLAWEQQIFEEHADLVKLVEAKLRRLRLFSAPTMIFVFLIFIYCQTAIDGLTFFAAAWMTVGLAILGLCAFLEKALQKPIEASQLFLDTYTLETFLEHRV